MATFNSDQHQLEQNATLASNFSALPNAQHRRLALKTVTFATALVNADIIVLGKLPTGKHRLNLENVRVRYGGVAWGATSLTVSLRRAPVTVGVNATTLGSIVCDGVGVEVVALADNALQAQADEDAIYYLVATALTGTMAVGATIIVELPYDTEGI